jgi:pilus assembly protein Flp/PilA
MLFYQIVEYVRSFVRRETGQDLAEYALILALVAVAAIGVLGLLGTSINDILTSISNALTGAAGS